MDINDVAVGYLAYRARTAKEMYDYLLKKGYDEEAINKTIENLKERKYIDDVSYVNQYIRYGFSKRKALYRIKRELNQKGVNQYDIEDGIYMFEDENETDINQIEKANAKREVEKILGNKDEIDQKLLDKAGRRLNTLGYHAGMIFSILNEYR